jgi:hypothetical protein
MYQGFSFDRSMQAIRDKNAFLDRLTAKSYELSMRGGIAEFERSPRRQRYFSAWKRCNRMRYGQEYLYLRKEQMRCEANWQAYCRADGGLA